jgi:DNA invertase Pin-like site-specific DNA recombinase
VKVRTYCRVSTHDQTLEQQRSQIADYCSARNWEIVQGYDEIQSTRDARPIREKLLKDMRHGEAIVTVRMDRIGRSTRELLELAATCEARGVALVFVKEQIDFSTDAGRLYFRLLASISEFERDLISSRTKEKLAVVRIRLAQEGRSLGRPRIKIPEDRLRAMLDAGASFGEMSRTFHVSKNTVKSWLEQITIQKQHQ